jgi:DNA mismatch repair protein MutS
VAKREPPRPAKSDALAEALSVINPDELAPRDALDALYRLKQIAGTDR